jgi:hypothetical protein
VHHAGSRCLVGILQLASSLQQTGVQTWLLFTFSLTNLQKEYLTICRHFIIYVLVGRKIIELSRMDSIHLVNVERFTNRWKVRKPSEHPSSVTHFGTLHHTSNITRRQHIQETQFMDFHEQARHGDPERSSWVCTKITSKSAQQARDRGLNVKIVLLLGQFASPRKTSMCR